MHRTPPSSRRPLVSKMSDPSPADQESPEVDELVETDKLLVLIKLALNEPRVSKKNISEVVIGYSQKLADIIHKLYKYKLEGSRADEATKLANIDNKVDTILEELRNPDNNKNMKAQTVLDVSGIQDSLNESNLFQGDMANLLQLEAKVIKELRQEVRDLRTELRTIKEEDLQEIKENVNAIPVPISQPTPIETPNTTPILYSQALQQTSLPKPTLCLLVGTDNVNDTSEEVITKIKKTLNAKDTGLQISKLRKVKDQKVLIGCEKKGDLDSIREKLEGKKFKVETKANKDPLVIIKNVSKSNTDEDILQSLEKQNYELLDHIPTEEYRMKVRHHRRARNPNETHVVLEVSPKVWKALTTAGRVYVDLQRVPVFDLSPLVQCSRCLAFGHGKKWCTESTDLCSHCSGPHLRTECPSLQAGEAPICKNCLHAKCAITDHNSFDMYCPVRKKWDDLVRSSVAYE